METEDVTIGGVLIMDAPKGITADEARPIAEQAKAQGLTDVQYSQFANQQQSVPMEQQIASRQQRNVSDRQKLREGEQNLPPAPMEEQIRARQLTQEGGEYGPKTDVKGLAGGVLREALPYLAAGGTGFLVGGPVGALGGLGATVIAQMTGQPITEIVNNLTNSDIPNQQEQWNKIFTEAGIPEPDTAAERMVQQTTRNVGQTTGTMALGGMMSAGAPALGAARTTAQGAGQHLAANPAQQGLGAAGGTATADLMGKGVDALNRNENINISPGVKAGLQFGAGMAGDIMSSNLAPGGNVLTHPTQGAVDTFSADMKAARHTPDMVRSAIREGQEPAIRSLMDSLGVSREVAQQAVQGNSGFINRLASRAGLADSDISALTQAGIDPDVAKSAMERARNAQIEIYRTDAAPPSDQLEVGSQRTREALGGNRLRGQQGRARNAHLDTVINEFDLAPGRGPVTVDPVTGEETRISQQLADSLVEGRQTALNKYNTQWSEALDTLPKGQPLEVDNAIAYLDEQIDMLTRAGETTTDVNVPQTPGPNAAAESAMPNNNQATINRLEQYKATLQNKDKDMLEFNRRQLREKFTQADVNGNPVDPDAQILRGLYTSLRDDLAENIRRYGGNDQYSGEEMAQRFREAGDNLNDIHDQLNSGILEDLVKQYNQNDMTIEANPEVIYRVATSKDPAIVEEVMNMMDDNAQRLVETAVVQDIMENATENILDVSPSRFANHIHEQLDTRGVPMTEERKQLLEGTKNLLNMTRRPEDMLRQTPVDPMGTMTRAPGVRYGLARLLFHNVAVGGGLIGGSMLSMRNLSTLYESPQMRDTLLELAETGGRTQRAEELTRTLIRGLTNSVVQETVQDAARPNQNTSESLTETQLSPGM